MESSVIRRSAVAGLAVLIGAGLATAPQNTKAMDFTGTTIKIVIPYGPGGTYDKYGVAFTNHLGKHIPGNPNLILQHMPGAGGAKAMNWTYNVMPKNGLNMIVPLDNSVLNQLMRPEKMRYKAEEFTWLGSSNQTNVVMVARTDSGVRNSRTWKPRA
jgi:tripartite-type tricarboxylate transporter receptor subunit TctC